MIPGISVSPPASTISAASLSTFPIAAMQQSRTATSARIGSCPSPSTTVAPRITRSYIGSSFGPFVFYRRRMICIDPTGGVEYHSALNASIRVIRRAMDQPQSGGSIPGSLQAKGGETEPASAIREAVVAGDFGRGYPGKPVGAVVAAAKVLRILHE